MDKPAAQLSVLIVDDSPTQRAYLTAVCEETGISTILEAEDGIEALNYYEKLPRSTVHSPSSFSARKTLP